MQVINESLHRQTTENIFSREHILKANYPYKLKVRKILVLPNANFAFQQISKYHAARPFRNAFDVCACKPRSPHSPFARDWNDQKTQCSQCRHRYTTGIKADNEKKKMQFHYRSYVTVSILGKVWETCKYTTEVLQLAPSAAHH